MKSVLARSTLNDSPMGVGKRPSLSVNFFAGSLVERESCLVPSPHTDPRIRARCTQTTTPMVPRRVKARGTPLTYPRPSFSGPFPLKIRGHLDSHPLPRPTTIQTLGPIFLRSHTSLTFPATPSSTPPNHLSPCPLRQVQTSPSAREAFPRAPACPTRTTIWTSSRRCHKIRCKCTTPAR